MMKKTLSFLAVFLLLLSLSAACWADCAGVLDAPTCSQAAPDETEKTLLLENSAPGAARREGSGSASYSRTYSRTYTRTRPSVLSRVIAAGIIGAIVGLFNSLKSKKNAAKKQNKPVCELYICKNCGASSTSWSEVCPYCQQAGQLVKVQNTDQSGQP